MEEIETCGICLEDLVENIDETKCQKPHKFHKECLNKWLNKDYRCPYCRTTLKEPKNNYYDNHRAMVMELIERLNNLPPHIDHININFQENQTPLMLAIQNNYVGLVRLLIERGAINT